MLLYSGLSWARFRHWIEVAHRLGLPFRGLAPEGRVSAPRMVAAPFTSNVVAGVGRYAQPGRQRHPGLHPPVDQHGVIAIGIQRYIPATGPQVSGRTLERVTADLA